MAKFSLFVCVSFLGVLLLAHSGDARWFRNPCLRTTCAPGQVCEVRACEGVTEPTRPNCPPRQCAFCVDEANTTPENPPVTA